MGDGRTQTRSSFLAGRPAVLAAAFFLASAVLFAGCGSDVASEEGREAEARAASDAPAARDGTGGSAPEAVADAAARDSVLVELRAYYRDFSARDWKAFREHFWPDATITTIWRPGGEERERVMVQTAGDFADAGPEGPGSREIFEEEMVSHRVDVDGRAGVATVWADYRARFGDPGDVTEWGGTDVFTLLRHDGRWRIASLVFVPEAGDDAPPSEEESGP